MLRKTKPFNSDMLSIKWMNRTVIVASLIVLTRANGKGFSKDIFYFPCGFEINNMCSGYRHFLPVMFWILAGLQELASIFPKCSNGLDKPSYSWSDHQWVLTDLPLPVSGPFHKHFPLTGGDSLGDVSIATIQAQKIYTSSITSAFSTCYCRKRTKCSHSICEGYPGTL